MIEFNRKNPKTGEPLALIRIDYSLSRADLAWALVAATGLMGGSGLITEDDISGDLPRGITEERIRVLLERSPASRYEHEVREAHRTRQEADGIPPDQAYAWAERQISRILASGDPAMTPPEPGL